MTNQPDPISDVIEVRKTYGLEAALKYIDESENMVVDADRLHHLRTERIQLLHHAARFDEAISAARAFLPDASCKTAVFHDIGLAFYRMGDLPRAEAELSLAPIEDEVDRFEPFVLETAFLRFFIRNQLGKHVPDDVIDAFPVGYQQVTERGRRHGLDALRRNSTSLSY